MDALGKQMLQIHFGTRENFQTEFGTDERIIKIRLNQKFQGFLKKEGKSGTDVDKTLINEFLNGKYTQMYRNNISKDDEEHFKLMKEIGDDWKYNYLHNISATYWINKYRNDLLEKHPHKKKGVFSYYNFLCTLDREISISEGFKDDPFKKLKKKYDNPDDPPYDKYYYLKMAFKNEEYRIRLEIGRPSRWLTRLRKSEDEKVQQIQKEAKEEIEEEIKNIQTVSSNDESDVAGQGSPLPMMESPGPKPGNIEESDVADQGSPGQYDALPPLVTNPLDNEERNSKSQYNALPSLMTESLDIDEILSNLPEIFLPIDNAGEAMNTEGSPPIEKANPYKRSHSVSPGEQKEQSKGVLNLKRPKPSKRKTKERRKDRSQDLSLEQILKLFDPSVVSIDMDRLQQSANTFRDRDTDKRVFETLLQHK